MILSLLWWVLIKKKYLAQIEAVQQLAIEYKDYNIIT